MTPRAETFVVIFRNYWGKGASIAEAAKAARRVGAASRKKQRAIVLAYAAPMDKVKASGGVDVAVDVPPGTVLLRWEMDL